MQSKYYARYTGLKYTKPISTEKLTEIISNDDCNNNDNDDDDDDNDDNELCNDDEVNDDVIVNRISEDIYKDCVVLNFYENASMTLIVNDILHVPLYDNAIVTLKDVLIRLLIKIFIFKTNTGRSVIFSYAEEIENPFPKSNNLGKLLSICNNPSTFERIFSVMIEQLLPFLRILKDPIHNNTTYLPITERIKRLISSDLGRFLLYPERRVKPQDNIIEDILDGNYF